MEKEILKKLERGREHYEAREYDKAEPLLRQVAEAESGFADVMNMLGVIAHDKGQVALAQEYFEKSIRINPRYTEAALNLAVAYNEQSLYSEARKIHEHISSLAPNEEIAIEPYARGKISNMHADLGRAYAELQMFDKAIAQYRSALALSPSFADVRTRLGQILRDVGKIDAAIIEFKRVKKDRPRYVIARVSLGATYFAQGRKDKAKTEWNEVLEIDPNNRTAGMYLRMVEQMLAQDEADAVGMNLEIEEPDSSAGDEDESREENGDELSFSFDGQRASVTSVPPEPIDTEEDDKSSS